MKTKFFESNESKLSIQVACPTCEGKSLPFELVIAIFQEDKDIVLSFDKKTAIEIFNEFKHVIGIIECFG